MASECCLSLTKYFLFLFNLMFFVLGSLLLTLGLWIQLSDANFFIPTHPYISGPLFSNLLVIGGSVTMSLGFLGCLGSLKTVKCLLATYFILLTVLLAAQIVGGVLLYTQKTELDKSLGEQTLELITSFRRNYSSLQGFRQTIEYIQQEGKCCGWNGRQDWGPEFVPCSCMYTVSIDVNTTYESQAPEICNDCYSNVSITNHTCGIYEQGCSENIQKWLDENILFILVIILAIAVVEFLQWICLISYCCLNATRRCWRKESHGSHVQLSRDFTVEYWQGISCLRCDSCIHWKFPSLWCKCICGMTLSMCLYKENSVDYNAFPY